MRALASPDTTLRAVYRAVADLATRQDGVASFDQLVALGISAGMVQRWVACGRLHRLHVGVYAVGHRAPSRRGVLRGAVLACGGGALLSHRSAGETWRLGVPVVRRIDVTVLRRSGRAQPGIAVHRPRRFDPVDRTVRDGLPVTTVARTLLDLAEVLDERDLAAAWREAAVRRILDIDAVHDVLERANGRRGRRPLRRLVERHSPSVARTASPAEVELLALCVEHGLPAPVVNAPLVVNGCRYRADALWPDARLVVELDSWEYHGFREAFEADRRKDDDLRDAGYEVRRITARQLASDGPAVAARLRRALHRGRLIASARVAGGGWAD